jgi:hypothetical protein
MEPMTVDLNALFPGKPDPSTFPEAVAQLDLTPYRDQHVHLKGCAPTWAHLMIAARLMHVAAAIDFCIDDGKSGIVVPIWNAE